jgi:hypothetical protein
MIKPVSDGFLPQPLSRPLSSRITSYYEVKVKRLMKPSKVKVYDENDHKHQTMWSRG